MNSIIAGLLTVTIISAQERPTHHELENPAIQGINKEYLHASFYQL